MSEEKKIDLKMFISSQATYWEDYLKRNPNSILKDEVMELIKKARNFH